MGKRASNYAIQEKFQHFGNTVSHIFYKVLSFLLYLHAKTVNLPTQDDALHSQIVDDTKYSLYF